MKNYRFFIRRLHGKVKRTLSLWLDKKKNLDNLKFSELTLHRHLKQKQYSYFFIWQKELSSGENFY